MKQWDNLERKGTPIVNARKITFFEDLPEEMFTFEIPADANIIEQ